MAKRVETTRLQFEIVVNGEKKRVDSIKEVRKQRRLLNRQVEAGNLTQDEYNKKVAELRRLDGVLRDHRDKIRGIGAAAKEGGKSFFFLGEEVFNFDNLLKTTILGAIAALILKIIEFGKSVFDTTQRIQKTMERTNQVTGLTGDALANATAKAEALANVFGVDVASGIDAANAASNAFKEDGEELGDVYDEALTGIGARLASLDGKGDEFLEQIGEYSVQAQKAGLSMDRFFNLIVAGINKGIPTDKLIDSVKEFDLRIKNLSKGQKETLQSLFGAEYVDNLVEAVETGSKTGAEALDEIGERIVGLGGKSAAAQKAVSEIFGGAGEDGTTKAIEAYLQVGDSLDTVIDTTNVYYRQKQELLALEEEATLAQAKLTQSLDGTGFTFDKVTGTLKAGFYTFLAELVNLIRYFPEVNAVAWAQAKVDIQEFANKGISFLNKIATPINAVLEALGSERRLEIDLIEPDVESLIKAQDRLQNEVAQDRQEYEEGQRQKALEAQGREAAAKRLQALQEEKRRQEQLNKLTTEERNKKYELEVKAAKKIEELKTELMEESTEKRLLILKQKAEREIDELKVTGEKRLELERLIREQLIQTSIETDAKLTEKSIQEEQRRATDEIKRLEETQQLTTERKEQILAQSTVRTEQIINDSISRQLDIIDEQAQKELATVTTSGEESTNKRLEIEERRIEAIRKVKTRGEAQLAAVESVGDTNAAKIVVEKYKERLDALKAYYDQAKIEAVQSAAEEIEAGAKSADVDKTLKEKLLEQQRDFLEKKKAIEEELGVDTTQTDEEIAELELDQAKAKDEADLQAYREKWQKRVAIAQQAAQLLNGITDLVAANANRRFDEEAEALEEAKQRELEAAGDNAALREQIEEKYAKKEEDIQKRRAKSEQSVARVRTVIETAVGVAKALASAPFPANLPAILFATVQGAIQLATINAQKFSKGGMLNSKGGVPTGPSHAEGGILLVDGRNGAVLGEMEGEEPIFILSKDTYKNNREVVDRLMDSSLNRGGAPIVRDMYSQTEMAAMDPVQIERLVEAKERRPKFEDGGVLNAPVTSPGEEAQTQTSASGELMSELITRMDRLEAAYRAGKIILLTEREYEMLQNLGAQVERDRIRRAG